MFEEIFPLMHFIKRCREMRFFESFSIMYQTKTRCLLNRPFVVNWFPSIQK